MSRSRPLRFLALASAAFVAFGLALATPALADDDDHRRGWRDGRGWHHDRDDDDDRRPGHRRYREDRDHRHGWRGHEGRWHHHGHRPPPQRWGYHAPWHGHAPAPWFYRPGGYAAPRHAPPGGATFQLSIGGGGW
jgi:hypothetical protein